MARSAKKRRNKKKDDEAPVSGKVAIDRRDLYHDIAARRAGGWPLLLPRHLKGDDRRLHVRRTIVEDHAERIQQRPEEADAKFDKLARTPFDFFRGTALLFYRDMAGDDADAPVVLTLGDVHPENFGVMPSEGGGPIFGVNDFDEAYFAPFTWDIKRGCVGFCVAAKIHGITKKKHHKRIVRDFVGGYLDAIDSYASSDLERDRQLRLDNSAGVIKKLLKGAQTRRTTFLDEHLDDKRAFFRPTDEIVPRSGRRDEFQKVVDDYAKDNDVAAPHRLKDGELVVKDVAEKKGSGTASLGLPRYWVLLQGRADDGGDDVILEMKRARRSALEGLAPGGERGDGEASARIVTAHAMHLVGGDPFYGEATIDDVPFLVRERSPLKDDIDLDDLSKKKWRQYARECGRALALAHALADVDADLGDRDTDRAVSRYVASHHLFIRDMWKFTKEAYGRLMRDFELFESEHRHGAFAHPAARNSGQARA